LKRILLRLFTVIILLAVLSIFSMSPVHGDQRAAGTAEILKDRGLHPLLITALISMIPIFELRGSIPVGIAIFKQNIITVYIISILFNLVPVLPILYLLVPVRNFFLKRGMFEKFFSFLSRRASANREMVEKYEELGLALFVAIPLPVTGAWTGALVAAVMGLNPFKSFFFIGLGVAGAGILVTLLTILGMKAVFIVVPVIGAAVILFSLKLLRMRKSRE